MVLSDVPGTVWALKQSFILTANKRRTFLVMFDSQMSLKKREKKKYYEIRL